MDKKQDADVNYKLKQYQDVNIKATLATASPHKQIDMLFEGCLKFLVNAKVAIENNDIENRTLYCNKVNDILFALRDYLDFEGGGEIAKNLDALYDYMLRKVSEANSKNSVSACDEVMNLIVEVRTGWQSMPLEHK